MPILRCAAASGCGWWVCIAICSRSVLVKDSTFSPLYLLRPPKSENRSGRCWSIDWKKNHNEAGEDLTWEDGYYGIITGFLIRIWLITFRVIWLSEWATQAHGLAILFWLLRLFILTKSIGLVQIWNSKKMAMIFVKYRVMNKIQLKKLGNIKRYSNRTGPSNLFIYYFSPPLEH